MASFFGLFGKKKKNSFETIMPPPYTGARPFAGEDVGYGAGTMKSIADAYLPELKKRAMGEGLVGYDPRRRDLLRSEYNQDFNQYESDLMRKASAQASGQGLRGGIPSSISEMYNRDLSRARQSGLAQIDIEDLAANREDRNNAFYQLPQEVSRGAGIQQGRSNFDLAEYNASMPTYLEPQQDNILPALIGAAGTIGGAYFGGPAGAAIGGSIAQSLAGQKTPKRNTSFYGSYYDPMALARGRSPVY